MDCNDKNRTLGGPSANQNTRTSERCRSRSTAEAEASSERPVLRYLLTPLLILFLTTCWTPTCVRAQGVLELTVLSQADSTPVASVDVFAAETAQSTLTSPRGHATLPLPAGTDALTLTLYGNGFSSRQTLLPAGNHVVYLTPFTQNLSAVTVLAVQERQQSIRRLRAVEGTAIYAGKKTEVVRLDALTANKATGQARQIYAEVSGLNIYETDDAGLQLSIGGRGLDPNRSASFNTRQNGYDISADVLGYPESYYTPPAEALEEVQVVRGAASLQYGTQFGGLVNFVFRQPDKNRKFGLVSRQTVGSNGLFTSFNSVSGTVGKVGYYALYNYKRGDGFRPNSGFESHNAYVDVHYKITPDTEVSFEYTYLDYLAQQAGGLTDAQFYADPLQSNRTRNWFKVDWELLDFRLEHKFNDRTKATVDVFGLRASRSAVGFRTNRVSQVDDLDAPRDLIVNDFQNWGAEARLLHRYRLAGKANVSLFGAKYYKADNTALQGPGTNGSDADFRLATDDFPTYPSQSDFVFPNRNVALFGEHIFYLTDRLSITPGARFEYIRTTSEGSFRRIDFDLAGNPIRDEEMADDRTFGRNRFLLGLGLAYRKSDDLEFFANVSQNYRSVTFSDIRTVNPSFAVDPDIQDEEGFTADVGVRGRRGRLSYNANVFGIRYNNRIGEFLRADEVSNRILRIRTNVGAATIYGLESLLEYKLLEKTDAKAPYRLTTFANTSVTGSRYTAAENDGIVGNRVEFIPVLNVKTGLRFGYGNLLGSLQYSYLSAQFTDATNAPQDRRDNQSGIVGEIPAYGVADLSLSYKWRKLTLETGIGNLFNASYFTRRATGYPGPGIIPSAPRTGYLTVGVEL